MVIGDSEIARKGYSTRCTGVQVRYHYQSGRYRIWSLLLGVGGFGGLQESKLKRIGWEPNYNSDF